MSFLIKKRIERANAAADVPKTSGSKPAPAPTANDDATALRPTAAVTAVHVSPEPDAQPTTAPHE